jgi:hypothetical protein
MVSQIRASSLGSRNLKEIRYRLNGGKVGQFRAHRNAAWKFEKFQILQKIFEESMKHMPNRKKSIARQVRLKKYGWSPEHALAFEKIKAALSQSARLGYPRDDRIQCMFTDANEYNTSGMVTQIPVEDAERPVELQRHEPLGFVGHRFNATELNWSVAEKEGFAIKTPCRN